MMFWHLSIIAEPKLQENYRRLEYFEFTSGKLQMDHIMEQPFNGALFIYKKSKLLSDEKALHTIRCILLGERNQSEKIA